MKQPQVKEHFAKQADEYESLMVRLVPYYLEQHRIIRELLPDDDKEYRVLDLGCGNGVLSEVVFSKLPRANIVAFDLTENMLTMRSSQRRRLFRYISRCCSYTCWFTR